MFYPDGINQFTKIKFDFTERRIICTFLNDLTKFNGPKLCVVNFTYGSNCQNHLETYTYQNKNGGDSVTVWFQNLTRNNEPSYCFTILTNNGNKTVLVEGRLNVSTMFERGLSGLRYMYYT
jgi:hypothetical protein